MKNPKPRNPGRSFGRGHLRAAYRSGLEAAISAALASGGVAVCYEAIKVPFTQPAKARTYTPDWLLPNGIVVEGKGMFVSEDRAKHLLVKAQHPGLDLRFVFSNPNAKLYKGSPTTYADWCRKWGFKFNRKEIPKDWLHEPRNERSLRALAALGWTPR